MTNTRLSDPMRRCLLDACKTVEADGNDPRPSVRTKRTPSVRGLHFRGVVVGGQREYVEHFSDGKHFSDGSKHATATIRALIRRGLCAVEQDRLVATSTGRQALQDDARSRETRRP